MATTYERRPGESALFKNLRNPEKSDYNGQVDLTCECGRTAGWWISGWAKAAQSGSRYLALKFTRKGPKSESGAATAAADDLGDF